MQSAQRHGLRQSSAALDRSTLHAPLSNPKKFIVAIPANRATFIAPMPTKKAGTSKTRKAVAKRFKITGTGKITRRRKNKRHLLRTKNAKRRRRLGQSALVSDADKSRVMDNLPFG